MGISVQGEACGEVTEHALYQAMNGMTLQEMDRIIYPVCTLCRNHERAGFVEGIKIGVLLQSELSEK